MTAWQLAPLLTAEMHMCQSRLRCASHGWARCLQLSATCHRCVHAQVCEEHAPAHAGDSIKPKDKKRKHKAARESH